MHQKEFIQIDQYKYDQNNGFIGKGSFAKVYKAYNKKNEAVALKILDMQLFNDAFLLDSLINEIKIMKQLTSENVVHIQDAFGDKSQTYIVMEFCPNGDLRNFIRQNQGHLEEQQAIIILKQLMNGFHDLIKNNYIHRDFKPENALNYNNCFKLGDFGFATKADITGKQLLKDFVGTPLYMAPQLLQQQPYSAKSDIWSIGMVFYEMLFGKTPWPCRDRNSFLHNIQTQPLKFPYDKPISRNTKDFLKKSLTINEKERMGWEEIFNHPLLNKEIKQIDGMSSSFIHIPPKAKHILRKLQDIVQQHNINPIKIFNNFDRDKSNTLDAKEFLQLLKAIDQNISSDIIDFLFQTIAKKNNSIDFQEFQKLICETDFSDINDKAGQIIIDLREIIKANNLKLSDIFKNFDQDKQGSLDIEEFSKLLRVIAPALKDYEVLEVFKKFDRNSDGSISYEEFKFLISKGTGQASEKPSEVKSLQILQKLKTTIKNHQIDVQKIFNNFDKSSDALLNYEECCLLFKALEKNIDKNDCNILFQQFDQDGSGTITLDEFKQILQ